MNNKDSIKTQGWTLTPVLVFILLGVLANALVVPTWLTSTYLSPPLTMLASVFLALRTMRHPLLSVRIKYVCFAWSLIGVVGSGYVSYRSGVEPGEGNIEALVVTLVWQIFTFLLLFWLHTNIRRDLSYQMIHLHRLVVGICTVLVVALLAASVYLFAGGRIVHHVRVWRAVHNNDFTLCISPPTRSLHSQSSRDSSCLREFAIRTRQPHICRVAYPNTSLPIYSMCIEQASKSM